MLRRLWGKEEPIERCTRFAGIVGGGGGGGAPVVAARLPATMMMILLAVGAGGAGGGGERCVVEGGDVTTEEGDSEGERVGGSGVVVFVCVEDGEGDREASSVGVSVGCAQQHHSAASSSSTWRARIDQLCESAESFLLARLQHRWLSDHLLRGESQGALGGAHLASSSDSCCFRLSGSYSSLRPKQ